MVYIEKQTAVLLSGSKHIKIVSEYGSIHHKHSTDHHGRSSRYCRRFRPQDGDLYLLMPLAYILTLLIRCLVNGYVLVAYMVIKILLSISFVAYPLVFDKNDHILRYIMASLIVVDIVACIVNVTGRLHKKSLDAAKKKNDITTNANRIPVYAFPPGFERSPFFNHNNSNGGANEPSTTVI